MWDEKQFFDDFVKESDKIQPTSEFVADLKKLNNEASVIELKRKKNTRTVFRLASAAAAIVVLLAVGIGVYLISRPATDKPDDGEQITLPIHAGQDTTTPAETQGNEENEVDIQSILDCIADNDIQILDGDGNSITQEVRNDLRDMFEHAAATDSITGLFGENTEYIIKAGEDITVRIYFDEYILVNGEDMYHIVK